MYTYFEYFLYFVLFVLTRQHVLFVKFFCFSSWDVIEFLSD